MERVIAVYVGDEAPAVAFRDDLDDEGRDRWKAGWGDEWVTGAIDFACDDAVLGDPLISDLKTGRREDRGPRDRRQMAVYALAAHLITGADRVVGNVVLHPRYPKAADPVALWGEWSASELRAFHRQLVEFRRRVRGLDDRDVISHLTAGDHCTFCPSRRACPVDEGQRH